MSSIISRLLFFVFFSSFALALNVASPYSFPPDFKNVTINGVIVQLAAYETVAFNTPTESQHVYQIRVNNTRNQILNIPQVTHQFNWTLWGGLKSIRFWNRTSISNRTVCYDEYFNRTDDVSVCIDEFDSEWEQVPFQSLVVGRRTVADFAIVINTTNWASGSFNYSLNGTGFSALFDPTVSACGSITTSGTYVLDRNIVTSATTTCLNISSNNVVLDCAGYSVGVTGTTVTNRYPIFASNVSAPTNSRIANLTIKNCVVNQSSANITAGILLTRPENYTITNNTIGNYSIKGGANGTNGASCGLPTNGQANHALRILGGRNGSINNNRYFSIVAGIGGIGGNATGSNPGCDGANGGDAFVIRIDGGGSFTDNLTIENETIVDVYGGGGGLAGNSTTGTPGTGGQNGQTIAIYSGQINGVRNLAIKNIDVTSVSALRGGRGGIATGLLNTKCDADSASGQGTGGAGNGVTLIFLVSGTNISIDNVTFRNFTGSKAGEGGIGRNLCDGIGGYGGITTIIEVQSTNVRINNITGETPVYGGFGGDSNICSCTNFPSGDGGFAYGIILYDTGNITNSYIQNLSSGVPGNATYKGAVGSAYALYLSASSNSVIANTTFAQLDGYMTYADLSSINMFIINSTFANTSKFFYTAVDGYECNPCNYTVQWYGRVNVTDEASAPLSAFVNVSDNQSRQQYFTPASSLTEWVLFNDSIYNDTLGSVPAYSWNGYNVSANTTTLRNYTYFNYSSRDLTCWVILSSNSPPSITDLSYSNYTQQGFLVNFSGVATDGIALSSCIFSFNLTGVYVNESPIAVGGTSAQCSFNKSSPFPGEFGIRLWVNDSSNVFTMRQASFLVTPSGPQLNDYAVPLGIAVAGGALAYWASRRSRR